MRRRRIIFSENSEKTPLVSGLPERKRRNGRSFFRNSAIPESEHSTPPAQSKFSIKTFIFLSFWLVLCVSLSKTFIQKMLSIHKVEKEIQSLEQENTRSTQEISSLEAQIYDANTPFAQESIIRNNLGMQKPGETVLLLEKHTTPSPTPQPQISTQKKRSPLLWIKAKIASVFSSQN